MTRFEYYTQNLHELAELLTDAYCADPYQDDDAWTIDGYDSCEEWLASEVGAKGEFSWQKNKKEKTLLESYYDMAFLDMISREIKRVHDLHEIPYGKTIEFAPYKPLEVKEVRGDDKL